MEHLSDNLLNRIENRNKIYFVCSGNIIRSSYAHLLAEHLGIKDVASFGTTYHNSEIHPRSAQRLIEEGIDKERVTIFSPTHISTIDGFSDDDVFFIMTKKHLNDLLDNQINRDQIFYITELLGKKEDIADPYFSGNYDQAYTTIRAAIDQFRKID